MKIIKKLKERYEQYKWEKDHRSIAQRELDIETGNQINFLLSIIAIYCSILYLLIKAGR